MRYIGNNVEINPIDVPIHMTFVVLLNMIYDIIGIDRHYQLVLKCRHPTEMNKFQPLVVRNDQSVACMLAVPSKYGVSSIQLFIKQVPNHYHLSNEMSHLTRLSVGDTDVDDEMKEMGKMIKMMQSIHMRFIYLMMMKFVVKEKILIW